jgi:hypothetical protein
MIDKSRMERRLKTERQTLLNIDAELVRWNARRNIQVRVVEELEQQLAKAV